MSTVLVAEQEIAGKNAIIKALQEKMGTCPYYGTTEILDEVLIQKPSWGGKDAPENKTKLSAVGNVAYMQFAASQNVQSNQSLSYYAELYEAFLKSEKPVLTEANRYIQILKILVNLRNAYLDERQKMVARIRNRGKDLDLIYPIADANRVKPIEKFRKEKEPLLIELKEDEEYSWQNLIAFGAAPMGYVQKAIIEKEIQSLVEQHPIWKMFGAHIQGFGTMTCALFIAKLQDPKRFADSGKIRAFAGMAPIDGKTMRRVRGQKSAYDSHLKETLCEIFPDSFMKTSSRKPDEPYAQFFQACRAKQRQKAINTTPAQLAEQYKVPIENITPLGFGTTEEDKDVFKGFKVKKENGEEITTLNPGHVLQRAKREFGSMFISDFYHAWLFLAGENKCYLFHVMSGAVQKLLLTLDKDVYVKNNQSYVI